MAQQHIFLTNLSPAPDAGEEFERVWPIHVRETVENIVGFVACQRYRLAPEQRPWSTPAEWRCMQIYELEGDDVDAIHADNTRVREAGIWSPFRHAFADGNMAHVYTPVGDAVRAAGWRARQDSPHLVVVRSNPTGDDDAFNRWYDVHQAEVVEAIDGFVGAQRFRLNASQRAGMRPSPWRYVTIYELDGTPLDRVYAAQAEVKRNREAIFTPDDGVLAGDLISHVFEFVPPRFEEPADKAKTQGDASA